MRHIHVGFAWCWIFILLVTPFVVSGQVVQQEQPKPAAQSSGEHQKHQKPSAISLAKSVIERHSRTKIFPNSTFKNKVGDNEKYVSEIQALSESLGSLKPSEQAFVIRAINCLTIDATAAICSSAIEQHETGKLSDEVWIETLWNTWELLPARMNDVYLSALEIWEQKYPETNGKTRSPNEFSHILIYQQNSSFHELALKSKNASIASTAIHATQRSDTEHLAQLEISANRHLRSTKPRYRLYGVELFSRLNPTWKGHQSLLKKLTDDPDKGVSRAATWIWLNDASLSNHRRLLEALSGDSDIEKLAALKQIDANVTSDWGTTAPITELAASGSIDVRKAALQAVSRTDPNAVKPFIKTIENKSEQDIRQFALDRAPLRGWLKLPKHRPDKWTHLRSVDSSFSLLADARRDGLAVEPAMQKLTEPFGNHPQTLYDCLGSEQLGESKKLAAIAQLLASDPSLQATETANASLRQIIANNLAKNKKGYLGQASPARTLITLHAERLAPIVGELCTFIEQTKSTRLVKTLPSFGLQAEPSLNFLIKILEDDSGQWRDSRATAIITIRELQHHGKPAIDALLKAAHHDSSSVSLMAALTYLDLGGAPEALMPKYALRLPVLVKIDPTELITIDKFKSELRSAVTSNCPWHLLLWLGPRADFLMPELKLKFKQPIFSGSSNTKHWIALLPLLPSSQEAFLPICIEHIEKEPRSIRCRVALNILAKIGDDQRLAESAVKSVMTSGGKYTRPVAKACYETLYDKED